MTVEMIRNDNFEQEVLQARGPVLVDFQAPWCGYCRRLGPVVDRVAEQYSEKIRVVKLDIDESPDIAQRYEVDTIPTLILFQNGNAGEPLVNPGSQSVIDGWLRENGAL